MLPYVTAAIGFIVTFALTVFLMGELMPRSFIEWQRGSENRPVIVGMAKVIIALVAATLAIASESERRSAN